MTDVTHDLSLRDYFAAHAIETAQSVLADAESGCPMGNARDTRLVAVVAYQIADAMMAEREKDK